MFDVLKFISMLPMVLEFLSRIIKEVEGIIKEGKEKKNAVMEAIKEFLSQFGINFDRVKNMVSALIDSYVFFYNIAGLFTHR